MKSKKVGILIITLITILSFSTAVQAANKVIGQKINILYGILGDVNGDKKITKEDSEAILKHITGTKSLFWLGERKRADADQDNKITSADSLAIIKYINQNNETVVNVSSISISGANTVNVDETVKLTATILPSNASNKEIIWTSNYSIRAEVDENGIVKGKKAGKVTITAEAGGKKDTYTVEVKEKEKTITKMEISKLPTKTSYNINETIDTKGLELKVTYNTGETEKVTSGFTVSPTKVTKAGQQDISVTYKGKTCKYKVTVEDNKVSLGSKAVTTVTKKTTCPSYLDDKTNINGYWVVDFIGEPDVKNINMNKNSNYKCSGAVALYYANVILGKNPSKSAITSAYVSSSSETTTNFPGGGYEYKKCGSYDEQIKTIYDEILKGNPVPLPVKNSSGQAVYVLAYAIKANAAKNGKVLAKDIAVIDTKTGGYTNLNAYYVYTPGGVETYALATRKQTVQIEGMNLYNSNGSVNENKIKELQNYLTNMVGLRDGAYMYDRFDYLQCPWWAYVRASQYLGRPYPSLYASGNNGAQWYKNNKELGYFSYGKTPQPNSIVVWPKTGSGGSAGHVGYVEAVDTVNKKMYVSHAGGGNSWYGIQKMNYNHLLGGIRNNTPTGFIYLDEPLK